MKNETLFNDYGKPFVFKKKYNVNAMKMPRELHDRLLAEENLDLPFAESVSALKKSHSVGNKIIPNSICVQPAECWDALPDGNPSDTVRRRYVNYARGGSGILWFEAFGVTDEGKDGPLMSMMKKENVPAAARLIDEVNAAASDQFGENYRPYKVLQLQHSGRRSTDNFIPRPIAGAYNPCLDASQRGPLRIASDDYIDEMIKVYIDATENAADAGFDAVDYKFGHYYFLSDLMSAFTRPGKYGGSYENRTRALLDIMEGAKKRCGDRIDLCIRVSAYDQFPYPNGWGMVKDPGIMEPDLTEPVRFLKQMRDIGVKMVNITCFDINCEPYGDGAFTIARGGEPNPYRGIYALLDATRQLKEEVPELLYVGTGLSLFEKYAGHVGAGCIENGWFDIAGFGRMPLAYPDYANDLITKGALDPSRVCTLCNRCHELWMVAHKKVGCVTYGGEEYKKAYRDYKMNA